MFYIFRQLSDEGSSLCSEVFRSVNHAYRFCREAEEALKSSELPAQENTKQPDTFSVESPWQRQPLSAVWGDEGRREVFKKGTSLCVTTHTHTHTPS